MTYAVPAGFRFAAVHCGVKRNPAKPDLTLIACDRPTVAAGVYTQNLVHAAPVALNRSRTPSDQIRAVVINSGNANACTGPRGLGDAERMAALAAAACGAKPAEALVMSTGVIGQFLPMEKITEGIRAAARKLAADEEALLAASRGMLTTDTVNKVSSRTLALGGRTVHLTGMAKGAAMIGPRMATMLCVVLTDAPLTPPTAQQLLSAAVGETFNCISVDGHMSTNDTVLLLASGAAGGDALAGDDLQQFSSSLVAVCTDLARAIPSDGEGCTHLVTIDVAGCTDRAAALKIAKTIAESPLVKTAIAGADPNWGRIVSAAGYSGIGFDPARVSLEVNGFRLYEHGAPVSFDESAVSASMRDNHETAVRISFAEGPAAARFWTTDLTPEYVRLNADYRT